MAKGFVDLWGMQSTEANKLQKNCRKGKKTWCKKTLQHRCKN